MFRGSGRVLEPAAGCEVVLTRPGAYLLRTAEERIDVRCFERLAREGRRALAANAPGQAAADLREALALWRGTPLIGVGDESFAQAEIARLEELRASVIEDRIEADLALGPVTQMWSVSLVRWLPPIRCESGSISC